MLELFDIDQRAHAVNAITSAITATIAADGAQTDAEVKRRFSLAYELVKIMRFDIRWSWQRITDELPAALRTRINGDAWVPSERRAWYANETSGLILPPPRE